MPTGFFDLLSVLLLCPASMPFKGDDGMLLPTCDVEMVYREWKDDPSVRMVACRTDRIFESSKTSGADVVGVRFNIKDAVHNQCVLKPLLHRMAQHPHHPVPYVKELAKESLARSRSFFIPWESNRGVYIDSFIIHCPWENSKTAYG